MEKCIWLLFVFRTLFHQNSLLCVAIGVRANLIAQETSSHQARSVYTKLWFFHLFYFSYMLKIKISILVDILKIMIEFQKVMLKKSCFNFFFNISILFSKLTQYMHFYLLICQFFSLGSKFLASNLVSSFLVKKSSF